MAPIGTDHVMDYEYAQRRRTFVAIAITLVLGPAAFLLTRGDDDAATAPDVTVIGTPPQTAPGSTVDPGKVAVQFLKDLVRIRTWSISGKYSQPRPQAPDTEQDPA